MIKMSELKECLEKSGLHDVKTYIQSGNIIFKSEIRNIQKLAKRIEETIEATFGLTILTVVLSHKQLKAVVDGIPKGWLENPEWKYNYLFLKSPFNIEQVIDDIGELKPDIEAMTAGKDVLYQSMSIKMFGRTTAGKLVSKPSYKIITIRNHNTVTKLLALLESEK